MSPCLRPQLPREQAPDNLTRLGIAGVVAESFGRFYFRDSVAMAFPILESLNLPLESLRRPVGTICGRRPHGGVVTLLTKPRWAR